MTHRTVGVTALVLPALVLLASCGSTSNPGRQLEEAQRQRAAGNYGVAAVELHKILDENPKNVAAQLLLADVSLQSNSPDLSTQAIESAASSGADAATLAPLRARLQVQKGQFAPLLAAIDDGSLPLAEPRRGYFRAQALKGLQRFDEAAAAFSAVIATGKSPVSAAARVGLAECLAGQGNLGLALKTLESATAAESQSSAAWLALGNLQRLLGQRVQAEASWKHALQYAAGQLTLIEHVGLISMLADAALLHGDLAAAQALYSQLVAIAPQGAATTLLSARLSLAKADSATAASDLQRLLTGVPQLGLARPVLAAALLAQGTLEQAETQIATMLQAAPENFHLQALQQSIRSLSKVPKNTAAYWLTIGASQAALGVPEAARVSFRQAATTDPGSVAASAAQASLDLRTGRLQEALAQAQRIFAANRNDPMAAALLGESEAALEHYPEAAAAYAQSWSRQRTAGTAAALSHARQLAKLDQALEPLQSWLADHPGDAEMRGVYAEALRVSGERDRAVAEYQRLLKTAPGNAAALNNLAWLYYLQKDARALPTARQAYQAGPRAPQIADTYGWLLLESGNLAEGLKLLHAALLASPGQPEFVYHYAVALARSGDRARARPFLEGALALPGTFDSRAAAEQFLTGL